jgi:hypothetical protein
MLIYSKQPIGPSADLKERMLDTATGLVYEKYGSGNVFVHRIGGNSSGATYVDDAAIALWALLLEQATPATRQPDSFISEDQPVRPTLQQLIFQADNPL